MSNRIKIFIKRIDKELPLPEYQTENASGMDIYSRIDIVLTPSNYTVVPTGISVEIPTGYEMQIRPRSGLAANYGIGILNTPGTIDADYRGEVKVILYNIGREPYNIKRGERIAQAVISPVVKAKIQEVETLGETPRGNGGFGSTGRI